ncbi:MAG: LysR family transcriptional regulator [Sphingomonadales bacterium]|nr:LysR family transcriptional regulator [Sphingomonadales bacterium]NCQ21162.1 LysR family transcriptional regulator [Sphingomonadales bacterium]NCT03935.1 LysR family transcriptional regulator [Sphingomonadales bacterium]
MRGHSLAEFDAVIAIARKGSFRAAALDLGLSTSALSNIIARLEGQLGVRLFNRTTRSVALTEAGRRLIEQVAPALADIHHALDTVRAQQDTPAGTLRINTFATAGREILAPLVLECLRRFPLIRIDLVSEGNLVDIVADGFDCGIRSRDLVPSDMIAIPLGPARRHAVVAAPAYIAAHGVPHRPADLAGHACIRTRLPNGALLRWQFEVDGQPAQVEVDGPLTLDEASLARLAVLAAIGIGYFMESDVAEDMATGRLVRLLGEWSPPLAPLCLYYPSRRNPPAAFRVFVELARELARTAT